MRTRARSASGAALGIALLAVAGCSSSSSAAAGSASAAASSASAAASAATPASPPASGAAGTPPTAGAPGTTAAPVPPGTPNGVEALSAADILARTKAAARAAGSVHITAQAREAGGRYALDARAGKDKGTGELISGSTSFTVRRIGPKAYLRGNSGFYEQVAGSAAAAKRLDGRWLEGPAEGEFANAAGFVSLDEVVNGLLDPRGTITKGKVSSVDGQRTILLLDKDGAPVHVALDGEPYALRVESGPQAKARSRVDLREWGAPFDVTAPPADEVVDVSKIRQGG